jgi:uncharacterized protein (TIGR02145 family)
MVKNMTYQKLFKPAFTLMEIMIAVGVLIIILMIVVPSLQSVRAKGRDTKRVGDIQDLQSALSLYYHDEGQYPDTVVPGQALIGVKTGHTYLKTVPTNPKPWSDTGCPDKDYAYYSIAGGAAFAIDYCLSNGYSNVSAGPHVANQDHLSMEGATSGAGLCSVDKATACSGKCGGETASDGCGGTYTCDAPASAPTVTGLSATTGSGQVNLDWDGLDNASSYLICYSATADTCVNNFTTTATAVAHSAVISGLDSGTYYFTVKAKICGDTVTSAAPSQQASAAPCTSQTNLQFCSYLGKNCGLVTGLDTCGDTRTNINCGSSCSAYDTCGGGGTANVCGCTANCNGLCAGDTDPVCHTSCPTNLATVGDVANLAAIAGPENASLNWDSVSGAGSYAICYSTDSNACSSNFTANVSTSTNSTVISGLAANTLYYFAVKATKCSGAVASSGLSNVASATPAPLCTPNCSNYCAGDIEPICGTTCSQNLKTVAQVTGLAATPAIEAVSLDWSDTSGATSYDICYSTNATTCTNSFSALASTSTSATVISGLTGNTAYYFTIKAKTCSGAVSSASPSAVASATAQSACTPNCSGLCAGETEPTCGTVCPTNLKTVADVTGLAAVSGNAQVSLSWSNVANATSYDVCYSTNATACTNSFAANANVVGNSAVVGSLTNDTLYYFTVKAKTCSGNVSSVNPSSPTSSTPTGCVPSCSGKVCGDNGCGGICGTCSDPTPYCTNNQMGCTSVADCPVAVCGDGTSLVCGSTDFQANGSLALSSANASAYQTATTYAAVKIGNQCWMRKNLNVGTMVTRDVMATANPTTQVQRACYSNSSANCSSSSRGGLYQYHMAMYLPYSYDSVNATSTIPTNGFRQGICPKGWHIPSDYEWSVAENYLDSGVLSPGGSNNPGVCASTYHSWHATVMCSLTTTGYGNRGATAGTLMKGAGSGLSLPLSGIAYASTWYNYNTYGMYLSATQYSDIYQWSRRVYSAGAYSNRQITTGSTGAAPKTTAMSVRCIKDYTCTPNCSNSCAGAADPSCGTICPTTTVSIPQTTGVVALPYQYAANLSWNAVSGATSYDICASTNATDCLYNFSAYTTSVTNSKQVTGLTAGVYYYFTIKARMCGDTALSVDVSNQAVTIPSSCAPESDPTYCSRNGLNCGSLTNVLDNCSYTRNVASCGSCTGPQTCGGSLMTNVCGNSYNAHVVGGFGNLWGRTGPVLSLPPAVAVVGNTAYVLNTGYNAYNAGDALNIFDIANPASPVLLSKFTSGEGGSVFALASWLKVVGNYAYISGYDSNTLSVINIANPAAPVHAGTITVSSCTGPGYFDIVGSYLYMTCYTGGLKIINISNPASPTMTYSGNSFAGWRIDVEGNYAYMTHGQSNSFTIVDISTPATPVLVSNTVVGPATFPASVAYYNGAVYIFNQTQQMMYIYNVVDPVNPAVLNALVFSNQGVLDVKNGFLYSGSSDNYIKIYSLSNPFSPSLVGTVGLGNGGITLSQPYHIDISGNYLFIPNRSGASLEVADITDKANATHVTTIANGTGGVNVNSANSMYAANNYLFVAGNSNDSIGVINVANPLVPAFVGNIVNGAGNGIVISTPTVMTQSGNYLYVLNDATNIMEIIDISNINNPIHGASISTTINSDTRIVVQGNYAYLAGSNNDFKIYDVTNPTSPINMGYVLNGSGGAILTNIKDLKIDGNYAYIAGSGLEIINISNPASPVHAGKVTQGQATAISGYAVAVTGNYAYVANNYSSTNIEIIDVTSSTAPVLLGGFGAGSGGTYKMEIRSNALILSNNFGVPTAVYNITNRLTPVLLNSLTGFGSSMPAFLKSAVLGDYVYLSASYAGNSPVWVVSLF